MAVHFGEHITIDGYGGDPKRLDSEEAVHSALVELSNALRMRLLAKPQVVSAPDNHIKDPGGWSGFVIIAESHISIHTFPKRRFVSADVYTCQNGIDTDFVINFFKNKFKLKEVETHFIKRGMKYPAQNLA
jgi:S-adenosylmethionine decarboxylase